MHLERRHRLILLYLATFDVAVAFRAKRRLARTSSHSS